MAAVSCAKVCRFLREILKSRSFDFEDCHERKFTLSQAFCLLWQNPRTGEIQGQMVDEMLHQTVVALTLLDLMALGRIELYLKRNTALIARAFFPASKKIFVKVIDRSPTGTFLDDCIFNRIIKFDNAENTVSEWIFKTRALPSLVLSTVLHSLVKVGIFDKEQKKFGRRYPTINPEPQQELRRELQMIALLGGQPDGFMWPLIKLVEGYDSHEFRSTSILEHQFNAVDYPMAKFNIESLFEKRTPNFSKKGKRPKKKERKHCWSSFDNLLDIQQ